MRRLPLPGTLLVLAVLALTTLAATGAEDASPAPEPVLAADPIEPAIAPPAARPPLASGASPAACAATAESATVELQLADFDFPRCGFQCEGSGETFCAGLSCQGSPAFVPCSCEDGRWRCEPC